MVYAGCPPIDGASNDPIPWATGGNLPETWGDRVRRESGYVVADSGEREHFDSGMQRDTAKGKPNPLLVRDGPMYRRWVNHLTAGAVKYDARNWMRAEGIEEFERFLESASRHFDDWLIARIVELAHWRRWGEFVALDSPEDEAAATWFNMNAAEFVREVMDD